MTLNAVARSALAQFPAVRMLPAFDSFQPMHKAHHIPEDCSHFCYAPLLWDAAIMPFYLTLVDYYRVQSLRLAHTQRTVSGAGTAGV